MFVALVTPSIIYAVLVYSSVHAYYGSSSKARDIVAFDMFVILVTNLICLTGLFVLFIFVWDTVDHIVQIIRNTIAHCLGWPTIPYTQCVLFSFEKNESQDEIKKYMCWQILLFIGWIIYTILYWFVYNVYGMYRIISTEGRNDQAIMIWKVYFGLIIYIGIPPTLYLIGLLVFCLVFCIVRPDLFG